MAEDTGVPELTLLLHFHEPWAGTVREAHGGLCEQGAQECEFDL